MITFFPKKYYPEIVMGSCFITTLFKGFQGFIISSEFSQGCANIVINLGLRWFTLQSLCKGLNSELIIPLIKIRHTQIIVQESMLWLERNGRLVGGDCFVKALLAVVNHPQEI